MRPKSLILLLLALGCGLVASIGISQVIERNRQAEDTGEGTTSVFVALKDINYGEQLSMQSLKLEPFPSHLVPSGALNKIEDIEGRYAAGTIRAQEPILASKLMGSGAGNDASVAIPKGFRVVPVKVDDVSSISGLIKPSDRVDVLVYVDSRTHVGNQFEASTKTILQDVRVFAINEQWRRPEENSSEVVEAKIVSLLVSPSQAERVTLAAELGKVRLVLRSPDDDLAEGMSHGTMASDLLMQPGEASDRQDGELGTRQELLAWLNEQMVKQQPSTTTTHISQPVNAPIESFRMEVLSGGTMHAIEFNRSTDQNRWTVAPKDGASSGSTTGSFSQSTNTLPEAPVPPVSPAEENAAPPETATEPPAEGAMEEADTPLVLEDTSKQE